MMKCLSCSIYCLYDYSPFFIQKERKIYYHITLWLCVYLIHFLGFQFVVVNNDGIVIVPIQITFLYSVIVNGLLKLYPKQWMF